MRYVGTGIALLFAVAIGYLLGQSDPQDAAAQDTSPTKALKSRDVYYAGTEDLAPDEMRIVAVTFSNSNSGEWTPTISSPWSAYFSCQSFR